MAFRVIEVVVHADDDIERGRVLYRRSHDDPLYAAVEIALELVGFQELPGAFEHNVAAELAPGNVPGIGSGAEADATSANRDGALAVHPERTVPTAVDAVEFQQMGGRRGAALDLVDVDDVEAVGGPRVVILRAARRRTPHAERVARYAPCH